MTSGQTLRVPVSRFQRRALLERAKPMILFIAGVRSGKTMAGAFWLVMRMEEQPPGVVGMAVSPVYHMLESTLIPAIEMACQILGVSCQIKHSAKVAIIGTHVVLLRSADDPENLAGPTIAIALMDEAALTVPKAYERVSQRISDGRASIRQLMVATTPEGTRTWVHKLESSSEACVIRANSFSNPFLPADFRARMVETYKDNPSGWRNYVEGIATDATGSIYPVTSKNLVPFNMLDAVNGQIVLGMDWNVRWMVTTVAIWFEKSQRLHFMGEVVSKDAGGVTSAVHAFRVLQYLEDLQLVQVQGNRVWDNRMRPVVAYVDASGANKRSNAVMTDVAAVKNLGIQVKHHPANPDVEDRVAAFRRGLSSNAIVFDEKRCPETTRAFREHDRDKHGDPRKVWTEGDFQCDHYCDAGGYVCWHLMPFRTAGAGTIT